VELEYGELTLSRLLHKYKLARIPERRMDEFLLSHVEKACNVCLYFDGRANDTFCFNLDNNHQVNSSALIPEIEFAIGVLVEHLRGLGCEPLVVASGRGYHVWGRLDGPVANERLYDFMLRSAVTTVAALHREGLDYHRIKFNFYPDPRISNVVSLRLFGSLHMKNQVFSRILTLGRTTGRGRLLGILCRLPEKQNRRRRPVPRRVRVSRRERSRRSGRNGAKLRRIFEI
jgi:hypothetical protein